MSGPTVTKWLCSMTTLGHVLRTVIPERGTGGPHHRPHQLMATSSLDCHRLVEWGRHNELEASIMGAASYHVLGSVVAKPVETYLETLKWEVLPHPPYSQNIAPPDYHLFWSMTRGLTEQHFLSYKDSK